METYQPYYSVALMRDGRCIAEGTMDAEKTATDAMPIDQDTYGDGSHYSLFLNPTEEGEAMAYEVAMHRRMNYLALVAVYDENCERIDTLIPHIDHLAIRIEPIHG